jgi:hypothetical protein
MAPRLRAMARLRPHPCTVQGNGTKSGFVAACAHENRGNLCGSTGFLTGPSPALGGLQIPDGLVVRSCTSHPGVLGSIPKPEEPGKTGASVLKYRVPHGSQQLCIRYCSNKHTHYALRLSSVNLRSFAHTHTHARTHTQLSLSLSLSLTHTHVSLYSKVGSEQRSQKRLCGRAGSVAAEQSLEPVAINEGAHLLEETQEQAGGSDSGAEASHQRPHLCRASSPSPPPESCGSLACALCAGAGRLLHNRRGKPRLRRRWRCGLSSLPGSLPLSPIRQMSP